MAEKFAGKYTFVSQDNFGEYLKAAGFGMIKRKALESLKPDVIIEVNGKKVKISNVTSVKTAVQEWTLDEPSKYDPGSGTEETFINSVEGNKIVSKRQGSDAPAAIREFTDSGFVQTYYAGDVTATRTFKKA